MKDEFDLQQFTELCIVFVLFCEREVRILESVFCFWFWNSIEKNNDFVWIFTFISFLFLLILGVQENTLFRRRLLRFQMANIIFWFPEPRPKCHTRQLQWQVLFETFILYVLINSKHGKRGQSKWDSTSTLTVNCVCFQIPKKLNTGKIHV